MGSGATINQLTPTVVPRLADRRIVSIAAGGGHSLAVDDSGGLWSWGQVTAASERQDIFLNFLFFARRGAVDSLVTSLAAKRSPTPLCHRESPVCPRTKLSG